MTDDDRLNLEINAQAKFASDALPKRTDVLDLIPALAREFPHRSSEETMLKLKHVWKDSGLHWNADREERGHDNQTAALLDFGCRMRSPI